MELEGHHKKTVAIRWHEQVENLIASTAIEKTVKVWDINEDRADDPIFTFADMNGYGTSLRWSPNGKLLGVPCKDKKGIMVDMR